MATYNYPADFVQTFWRVLDGDVYVSSSGNDISGDGSPTNPYATIAKAVEEAADEDKVIIGAGKYEEEIDGDSKNIFFEGDGIVIISETTVFTDINPISSTLKNVQITGNLSGSFGIIEDCFIQDADLSGFSGDIRSTVLVNVTFSTSSIKLYNCTCQNVEALADQMIEIFDSTFNADCSFVMTSTTLEEFDYCNVESGASFSIDATVYTTSSAIHTAFSQYQEHGLTADPKFNAAAIFDYTLKSDSTLLGGGRFGQNIGARQKGISRNKANATGVNLTDMQAVSGPDGFQLTPGEDEGTLVSNWIDMGKVQKLGRIRLYASDFFALAPSTLILKNKFENSAFDVRPLVMSSSHPNMVQFGMQWVNTVAEQATVSAYSTFVWDKAPTLDANGVSNGRSTFDATTERNITARYVRIFIRVTTANYFLTQEDTDCLLQENGSNLLWKTN